MGTSIRAPRITPEKLAQRRGVGVMAAKEALKVTTQKGIHYTLGPPECQYKTKQAQLRY